MTKTIWPTKPRVFTLWPLNVLTLAVFQSPHSGEGKTEVQGGSGNWPSLFEESVYHPVRSRAGYVRAGHPSVIWLFSQQVFSIVLMLQALGEDAAVPNLYKPLPAGFLRLR